MGAERVAWPWVRFGSFGNYFCCSEVVDGFAINSWRTRAKLGRTAIMKMRSGGSRSTTAKMMKPRYPILATYAVLRQRYHKARDGGRTIAVGTGRRATPIPMLVARLTWKDWLAGERVTKG